MPTPPLYAEFLEQSAFDDFFRWEVGCNDPAMEDGNVESPMGWFCVLIVGSDDIAEYVSLHGDPYASRISPGVYLLQQDNQGLVWVHFYTAKRRTYADFNRLRRLFTAWSEPVDDFGGHWRDITEMDGQ